MGKRGPKPGTGGRPKKALYDNLIEGNPGKRPLEVLDERMNHPDQDLTPPAYLRETGVRIFNATVDWLKPTGVQAFESGKITEDEFSGGFVGFKYLDEITDPCTAQTI